MQAIFFLLKSIRRYALSKNKIGMVAPAPPGSLGDEALIRGFANLIHSKSVTEILIYPNNAPFKVIENSSKPIFFKNNGRLSLIKVAFNILHLEKLYIIGADTFDGSYSPVKNLAWIDLANVASSIGIPTAFISFSFSKSPSEKVVNKLAQCHKNITFHSRDPKSKERFEKFTEKKCFQVADLAFSMLPDRKNEKFNKLKRWIDTQKEMSNTIIGLNINQLPLTISKKDILTNYTKALESFILQNSTISFVFIPHDFRDTQSDDDILSSLLKKLGHLDRVNMLEGPFSSDTAKAAAGELDFLLTGRMHLAIAALSQGVPSYCFSYKNKFEGLMQLLGIKDNLFPCEQQESSTGILEALNSAFSNYKSQTLQLSESLSSVKKMSADNVT